jgi:hypothetical protein
MLKNKDWKTDSELLEQIHTFASYTDLYNYRGIKALIFDRYKLVLVRVKKVIKHNEDYTNVITAIRFSFEEEKVWCLLYSFLNDKNGDPIDNQLYYFEN